MIKRHSSGRKTPLEFLPDYTSVQTQKARYIFDRVILRLDHDAGLAVLDDFRYRASIESKDRRAACHRLYHHEAKWLRPIYRKQ